MTHMQVSSNHVQRKPAEKKVSANSFVSSSVASSAETLWQHDATELGKLKGCTVVKIDAYHCNSVLRHRVAVNERAPTTMTFAVTIHLSSSRELGSWSGMSIGPCAAVVGSTVW